MGGTTGMQPDKATLEAVPAASTGAGGESLDTGAKGDTLGTDEEQAGAIDPDALDPAADPQ